jgi:hypothetical protein
MAKRGRQAAVGRIYQLTATSCLLYVALTLEKTQQESGDTEGSVRLAETHTQERGTPSENEGGHVFTSGESNQKVGRDRLWSASNSHGDQSS